MLLHFFVVKCTRTFWGSYIYIYIIYIPKTYGGKKIFPLFSSYCSTPLLYSTLQLQNYSNYSLYASFYFFGMSEGETETHVEWYYVFRSHRLSLNKL